MEAAAPMNVKRAVRLPLLDLPAVCPKIRDKNDDILLEQISRGAHQPRRPGNKSALNSQSMKAESLGEIAIERITERPSVFDRFRHHTRIKAREPAAPKVDTSPSDSQNLSEQELISEKKETLDSDEIHDLPSIEASESRNSLHSFDPHSYHPHYLQHQPNHTILEEPSSKDEREPAVSKVDTSRTDFQTDATQQQESIPEISHVDHRQSQRQEQQPSDHLLNPRAHDRMSKEPKRIDSHLSKPAASSITNKIENPSIRPQSVHEVQKKNRKDKLNRKIHYHALDEATRDTPSFQSHAISIAVEHHSTFWKNFSATMMLLVVIYVVRYSYRKSKYRFQSTPRPKPGSKYRYTKERANFVERERMLESPKHQNNSPVKETEIELAKFVKPERLFESSKDQNNSPVKEKKTATTTSALWQKRGTLSNRNNNNTITTATSVSTFVLSLYAKAELEPKSFEYLWATQRQYAKWEKIYEKLPGEDQLVANMEQAGIICLASGTIELTQKCFFFANPNNTSIYFLCEITMNLLTKKIAMTIKVPSDKNSTIGMEANFQLLVEQQLQYALES